MKHIISLLILFLCCTSLHAQDRVVEQPAFEVRNTNTLEFQKIILNDTATIMYATLITDPNIGSRSLMKRHWKPMVKVTGSKPATVSRSMRNSGCRNQVRPLSV